MRSLFLLLAVTGCEDTSKGGGDGISSSSTSVTSDSDGLAAIPVDVSGRDEAFLVTAESSKYLVVESIVDPGGHEVLNWEDWYDGGQNLTGAIFLQAQDVVVNWPVREEDGGLSKGTWTVNLATITSQGYYSPNASVDAVMQVKADGDLEEGKVKARVVYAQGVSDDADVVAGTEAAVERWKEIWGDYGMELKVEYADGSIDPDLPFPGEGGDDISDESAGGTSKDVTVIIGETIDGSMDYYGVAGSIPGALTDAPRSAVVVSWLANAGGDGTFSEDDIRLYGETLAHEVGHYTGLFHPVEMTWDSWDALDDTADCSNQSTCQSQLGDNLMFPYPVCNWSDCTPQDQLTGGQQGIGHRYTGCL